MPLAPEIALAAAALDLPWSSAPLRSLSGSKPPPDFFDDLAALDIWYKSHLKSENDSRIRSVGSSLKNRDELCETADTQKAPSTISKNASERPRLLVCHDFQGGYNDKASRRGYTFEYWSVCDIFIYFSHRRISCPPVGWNTAASRHGVKMLGTVIFEWKEAMPDLSLLLRGPNDLYSPLKPPLRFSPYYIPALIDLALAKNFSGYLINVELPLDLGFSVSGYTWYPDWLRPTSAAQLDEMQRNARRLRAWVALLRAEGRRRFAEAGRDEDEWTVLWYDSVTREGKLQWQDAVTQENVSFLEVSDGIFTNYTWARPSIPKIEKPDMPGGPSPVENAIESKEAQAAVLPPPPVDDNPHPALAHTVGMLDRARRARTEAYIGIDVFGRNCWGGAQSFRSLEMIGSRHWWQRHLSTFGQSNANSDKSSLANLGLSVALFAPGWTWEHAEPGVLPELKKDKESIDSSSLESRAQPQRRVWDEFAELDRRFWAGGASTSFALSSNAAAEPHSFHQPLSAYFPTKAPPKPSISLKKAEEACVFYHTTFARGSGVAWYRSGKEVARWQTPSINTDSVLAVSTTSKQDEEAIKKQKEAEEDQARAHVLVGWTDAGVSLPKADATWPHPRAFWLPTAETEAQSPARGVALATPVPDKVDALEPRASVEVSEDVVWAGSCSLKVTIPLSGSGQGRLFLPISWVAIPTTAGGSEEMVIDATALASLEGLDTQRVQVALRLVDGSIHTGPVRTTEASDTDDQTWTSIRTSISIPRGLAAKSTVHSSMSPQATLGLILESNDSTSAVATAIVMHLGELYLSEGSSETEAVGTASAGSDDVEATIEKKDPMVITWPDFAPAAHFYEVFLEQGDGALGSDAAKRATWLGTATREHSRTEFAAPLAAIHTLLATQKTGTIVVKPFGSCWQGAQARCTLTI
ncbi:hypothetical protein OC845_002417 [Tilletia horrida]|nr:hypothetical protein OC845_002417 [Tilletia horrida]